MKKILIILGLFLIKLSCFSQLPVTTPHPRVMMNDAIKSNLLAKAVGTNPAWVALKNEADAFSTKPVLPFTQANRGVWNPAYIFYGYYGYNYEDAIWPLAMGHILAKGNNVGAFPTPYSNKIIEWADMLITADADPANNCPTCEPIYSAHGHYPSRFLGMTVGLMFDYCYEELGAGRRASMIAMMNGWFDGMRVNGYQANTRATGNYFFGHVYGAASMGYATFGDNPRAQEMIDWARNRFDGLITPNVPAQFQAQDNVQSTFEGGYKPHAARGYLWPVFTENPQKGGFQVQGWSYGAENWKRILEYMLVVKSATGEDLPAIHLSWLEQLTLAIHHSLLPDGGEVDHDSDWGGNFGNVMPAHMPERLAYMMQGTPLGPQAQYLKYTQRKPILYYNTEVNGLVNWEKFYFSDNARPSANFTPQTSYSGFNQGYNLGLGNGALPYFVMRNNWTTNATWAMFHASNSNFDDHEHFDAGSFEIRHGNDYILTNPSTIKQDSSFNYLTGNSTYAEYSGGKSTLFFDDFGDYQAINARFVGGQAIYGKDDIKAAQMDDSLVFVRTNASSAYNASVYTNLPNKKLNYFYRDFLYLSGSNIFLTYDQVSAKNSTNPKGQYRKHIRWHFLGNAILTGNQLKIRQRNADLHIHTLVPASPTITLITEDATNPDNTFGSNYNFYFKSITKRAEVSYADNPLVQDYLTVLQANDKNATAPMSSYLASNDNLMKGANIIASNGKREIVFFNADVSSDLQTSITTTNYNFSGNQTTRHTLCGFTPSTKYKVSFDGTTIAVSQDTTGNFTSSIAGVLQFITPLTPCPDTQTLSGMISAGKYDSANTISTQNASQTQVLTGTKVILNGGKSISLLPTFEAQNGSVFKAYIGGCGY